jgi:hypothetical protein
VPALDPVPALNDPRTTDEDRDFLLALGYAQDWPASGDIDLSRVSAPHLRAIVAARLDLIRAHLNLIRAEKETSK